MGIDAPSCYTSCVKLILGLGNPGKRYQHTRHNFGFMVVEALAREWRLAGEVKKKLAAVVYVDRKRGVVLAKPETMMNNSGLAAAKLVRFYKVKAKDLWVVHDDLDFPPGKVRIKRGGGTAGHRGLESVIESLGTEEFNRVRLGIGHPGPGSSEEEVSSHVLTPFAEDEDRLVRKALKKAAQLVKEAVSEGAV